MPGSSNHGFCSLNNKLYSYGGRNEIAGRRLSDLWCFDTETLEWKKIETDPENSPPPLSACSLHGYDSKNSLYLLGGVDINSVNQKKIYRFSVQENQWYKCKESPIYMVDHSSVLVEDNIYVIVPYQEEGSCIYSYSILEDVWNLKKISRNIPGMTSRQTIYHAGKLYSFGGEFNTAESGDLHVYTINTGEWIEADTDPGPEARMGHMGALYKNFFLIFSGFSEVNNVFLNDSWMLSICTDEWIKVKLIGDTPSWRLRGKIASVGDKLYLFGGYTNTYLADLFCLQIKLPQLHLSLRNLFLAKNLCDFEIQGIPVHKSILKARTNIRLFTLAMTNVDYRIAYEFLNWIYSGELDVSNMSESDIKTIQNISDHLKLDIFHRDWIVNTNDLLDSISKMWGNFSNFTVIKGDKEIHVHKEILFSRSELFRGMFMFAVGDSVVDVSEISVKQLEQVLHSLYTSIDEPKMSSYIRQYYGIR